MYNHGYIGCSMSVNAAIAYDNGERPLSKWTKALILNGLGEQDPAYAQLGKAYTLKALKAACLVQSSWHHTSKMFNATDFYSVAEFETAADLEEALKQAAKDQQTNKPQPRPERWEVEYVEWEGRYRNYRHPKTYRDVGVILGNWFTSDSGKRKRVDGEHFELIRRIEQGGSYGSASKER